MLPFDEAGCVYETLAMRAAAVFPKSRIPLSGKFFLLLLTDGNSGLSACIGISVRSLHRLLRQDGLGTLELRTWARREALTILLRAGTPQQDIARLVGFHSVATLQAFLRREFDTTTRDLRSVERYRVLTIDQQLRTSRLGPETEGWLKT